MIVSLYDLFFLQSYPLLLGIVKEGGHLGLEECRNQFKNEIWNCTLDNKLVLKELPIFVKTTLPHGKAVVLKQFFIVPSLDVKALNPLRIHKKNEKLSQVTPYSLGIYGTSLLEMLKKLRMRTKTLRIC